MLIIFKHLRKYYFKRYIGHLLEFRIFTKFQVKQCPLFAPGLKRTYLYHQCLTNMKACLGVSPGITYQFLGFFSVISQEITRYHCFTKNIQLYNVIGLSECLNTFRHVKIHLGISRTKLTENFPTKWIRSHDPSTGPM